MHPMVEDHTTFIVGQSNYCYKVMPFGLNNTGVTYQHLMDKILPDLIGKNVETYVDDIVVKSMKVIHHIIDLHEVFDTLAKYQLKFNPKKCSFNVQV